MGAEAVGSQQAADARIEGSQTSAEIQQLNRDFQESLFQDQMARLEPRHDVAATRGLEMMEQYADTGEMDLESSPYYRMQRDAGISGLEGAGYGDNPYAEQQFMDALGAAETDAGYARLSDLMQIGMGASSSAGAGAQNFATQMGQSYGQTGAALAGGQMGAGQIRNSMYSNLAGQASSIPAYYSYTGSQRPTGLTGPSVPAGGIR